MGTNLQRAPGESEATLAPRTGLRRKDFVVHCISNQTQTVNAQAVGGSAGATVSAWTDLTIASSANPYGGTLVAQVIQGTPATKTVQLRVRGYDLFGQYQEEITPVISLVAKTNTFIYLAKLFSQITRVSFKSTGLTLVNDTISIGNRWDWTRTVDATNDHQAGRNLGIAIPTRLGKRPQGGASTRQRQTQPQGIGEMWIEVGGGLVGMPEMLRPDLRGHAKGFGLATGLPSANDTITIDSLVYTWKASVAATAREVLIGADATACMTNLAAAINAQGGSGTLYGSNTTAHPTVRASTFTGGYVVFIARLKGAIGNAIDLAESTANFTLNNASMLCGYDWPVEVVGLTVQDATGGGSAGAITNHTPQDFLIGHQQSGWDCPVEKLHFIRQSSVAQWVTTDNVFVRMTVLSAETAAQ